MRFTLILVFGIIIRKRPVSRGFALLLKKVQEAFGKIEKGGHRK